MGDHGQVASRMSGLRVCSRIGAPSAEDGTFREPEPGVSRVGSAQAGAATSLIEQLKYAAEESDDEYHGNDQPKDGPTEFEHYFYPP